MAIWGYLKNTAGVRINIETLGFPLPAGWTEAFDEEDIRGNIPFISWNRAAAELEALITAGDLEIRDKDNNIVPVGQVQAWIDAEILTESSLPPITLNKIALNFIIARSDASITVARDAGVVLAR